MYFIYKCFCILLLDSDKTINKLKFYFNLEDDFNNFSTGNKGGNIISIYNLEQF